jgi:hypothetical protein
MRLLSFTTGKALDTSVMILIVGLVYHAVGVATLFVLTDIYSIPFMGPMDLKGGVGYWGAYTFSGWGYRR